MLVCWEIVTSTLMASSSVIRCSAISMPLARSITARVSIASANPEANRACAR
jgi:hypothetical protein